MKRRTILLVVAPLLAVAVIAGAIGIYAAGKVPTPQSVNSATYQDEAKAAKVAVEKWEDYLSLTLIIATTALLAAGAVMLYHISTLPGAQGWRRRVFEPGESAPRERAILAGALAVALVISGLLLVRANYTNLAPQGDEISYLETAIETQERWGTAGFAEALYRGAWPESNRHPLYIWALMPVARRSLEFFAHARILTGALAAASVLVVFAVTLGLFGRAPAVLVAFLYGLNGFLIKGSSVIAAEPLLVSLVTLSFYFTARGFRRGVFFLPAGAFAGLAFMTKYNGLFLPAAFVAAALAVWRLGALRRKEVYLYLAAFAVFASPLLVRNAIRFHNPVANYNSRLIWLDRRGDTQTQDFVEGRTGFVRYLREHRPIDMTMRFFEGAEMSVGTAAVTIAPVTPRIYRLKSVPLSWPVAQWAGSVMLLVAGVFLIFDVEPGRRAFAASLGAIVLVTMAWYSSIAIGTRFVFPFMPIVLGYFAAGVMALAAAWRWRAAVAALAVLLAFQAAVARLDILHPYRMARPDRQAVILDEWLAANLGENDLYLVGPDDSLRLGWFRKKHGVEQTVPNTRTMDGLVAASRKRGARYLIISRNLYDMRHMQFSRSIALDEEGGLEVRADFNGLDEVFADPVRPIDYVVFRVLPEKDAAPEVEEPGSAQ